MEIDTPGHARPTGRRKGERTKTAIIEEAVGMASQKGLENLSIGELAKAMSLSKSGLFAHFQSKENLQIHVLEAAADRFRRRVVVPATTSSAPGEPRLRGLVERWLEWADRGNPGGCLFVSAAAELDDRPGPVREALVETQREWLNTLADAATEAKEVGHFKEQVDPEQLAFDLHSVLLGYHHLARLIRDPRARARATRSIRRLIVSARA